MLTTLAFIFMHGLSEAKLAPDKDANPKVHVGFLKAGADLSSLVFEGEGVEYTLNRSVLKDTRNSGVKLDEHVQTRVVFANRDVVSMRVLDRKAR